MIAGALLLLAAAPALNCGDLDRADQATLNMCAYRDFQRADAALNAEWSRVVTEVKQRDRDLDRSYDRQPGWFDTLLAGQRAWLTFRDKHCELESFQARGGSMQPMLASGCKAALTEARTRQLKSLIEE